MKLKSKSSDADKIQWLIENKHLWTKPIHIVAKHMQVAGFYSMTTSTNDMVNSINRLMRKIKEISNNAKPVRKQSEVSS